MGFTFEFGLGGRVSIRIFCHCVFMRRTSYSPLCIYPFEGGTVQAFGPSFRFGLSVSPPYRLWSASLALPTAWPTMPSADCRVPFSSPLDSLSPAFAGQRARLSRGKPGGLPCIPAGSTSEVFDGYGLCGTEPTRPASSAFGIRFLFVRPQVCTTLPSDASLRWPPLRVASTSPPSGCTGDFHPQATGHARHTPVAPLAAARVAPPHSFC